MALSQCGSPARGASLDFSAFISSHLDDDIFNEPLLNIQTEGDDLLGSFDSVAGDDEVMDDIVTFKQQDHSRQSGFDAGSTSPPTQQQDIKTQAIPVPWSAKPFCVEELDISIRNDLESEQPVAKPLCPLDEDMLETAEIDLFSEPPPGTKISSNFATNYANSLDFGLRVEQEECEPIQIFTQHDRSVFANAKSGTAIEDGGPTVVTEDQTTTKTVAMETMGNHAYTNEPLPQLPTNDYVNYNNTKMMSLTLENEMKRTIGQPRKLEKGIEDRKKSLSPQSSSESKGECYNELAEQVKQERNPITSVDSRGGLANMFGDLSSSLRTVDHITAQGYHGDNGDIPAASLLGVHGGETGDIIDSVFAQYESMNQTQMKNGWESANARTANTYTQSQSGIETRTGSAEVGVISNESKHEDGTISVSAEQGGEMDVQHRPRQKKKRTRVEDMDPAEVHVCPIADCQKKFAKKYNLKIHERRHRGDLPFLCPKCSKRFMWQSSFERHLRVHEARADGCLRRSRRMREGIRGSQGRKRTYYEIERVCNTVSTMMLQGNVMSINHLDPCSVTLAASLGMLNGVAKEEYMGFFEEGIDDSTVWRINKKLKMSKEEGNSEDDIESFSPTS